MQKVFLRPLIWLFVLALLLPGASALAVSADDIAGVWVTEGGKSHVQIKKVGSSFVGKIVWLKEPNRDGKPKLDQKNTKPSLRTRKIMGLSLLSGFTFKGDKWEGKIYNPEDGKEYSCELKLSNATTLNVRGYVFNPALGKTQVWKKK